jgi:hypothetical protein
MVDQCHGAYNMFALTILIIFIYFISIRFLYGFAKISKHDPMNKKLFELSLLEGCCSWWPISHFILFMILGMAFPNGCDFQILSAGILWEVVEMSLSSITNGKRQAIISNRKVEYSRNWIQGSAKDILFNFLGFYVGKLIYSMRKEKLKIPLIE